MGHPRASRRAWWAGLAVLVVVTVTAVLATTDTRSPTSNANSVWVNSGGADRSDSVDDPVGTPDDDTTYIWDTAGGSTQRFTFSAFTVPGGSTVNSVVITMRCKYIGTSADVIPGITNESVTTSSQTFPADYRTLTTSYTDVSRTFTTNPWTTSAWTVNEVNTDSGTSNRLAQMYVRTGGLTGTEVRCTQMYLTVDYTAGGTGGTQTSLLTLGVGE